MSGTVLVTGGTGFVAGWAIVELLKRGYNVRTTVRSLGKEQQVRAKVSTEVDPGDRLAFYAADLMGDAGWDAAVSDCEWVLHVAAPVGVDAPRDPDKLIVPTRDGALRVLRAACRANVRRVVLTSAVEACRPQMTSPDGVCNETRWTDTDDAGLGPYRLAKTLAERAAWDFMAHQSGPTTLTTILPSAVAGPILSADNLHSAQLVQRMLNGSLPRYPRLGFCVVDVRDVVDLHIRAMTAPQAAGGASSPPATGCGWRTWLMSCDRNSAPAPRRSQPGRCRTWCCGPSRYSSARCGSSCRSWAASTSSPRPRQRRCLAGNPGQRQRRSSMPLGASLRSAPPDPAPPRNQVAPTTKPGG